MSFLMVMLLSIRLVEPDNFCDEVKCGTFYTASNVRVDSCVCNETTNIHEFVYPSGSKFVEVNYNVSYPITHDFYQNHTLVGRCPKGLLCSQTIHLDPVYPLVSTITEHLDKFDFNDTSVNMTNNEYDLFFYPG